MRMGHPVLREVAHPVDVAALGSPNLVSLVADMVDTLHDYGGIGLAAPQIGEPVRLAIIEIPGGASRYGELPPWPLTIFVNPEIEVVDPKTAGYWEGCLSVPGLRGFVCRPQHVKVSYLDLAGSRHVRELEGFLATVIQHEFDHLDGKLFIDRIDDTRLLAFETEYERYLAPRDSAASKVEQPGSPYH